MKKSPHNDVATHIRRRVTNDVNILALFGIEATELESYEQTDSGDGWVSFRIRKAKADIPCPGCGSLGCHVKDYTAKSYRFRFHTGAEVRVLFEHRRLFCPSCGKAFFEPNPFMRKGAKVLSKNKVLEIVGYLKDGLPNTLVAKYAFVSEATVSRVIDKVVKAKRRRFSRIVSIDEFCSFNSAAKTASFTVTRFQICLSRFRLQSLAELAY